MNFEEILTDEQWVDDATGLIPHCLAILKTCRYLTERLTALAMNSTPISGNFYQIVEVTNCNFFLCVQYKSLISAH